MAASIHASCFSYHGTGCLLLGPSGSGKSMLLAKSLMLGAHFVADDQVELDVMDHVLYAQSHPNLEGVIELRGLGLVRVEHAGQVPVQLAVELGAEQGERLPVPETISLQGVTLPLLRLDAAQPATVEKLMLYCWAMQEKRILPQDWRPAHK